MKRPHIGAVLRACCSLASLLTMLVACLFVMAVSRRIVAQNGEAFKAELTISADQPKGTINRNIYGNFAEHLGRDIYDGIWVGEDSSIPNTRGIHNDIIAALKNLNIPLPAYGYRAIRSL